MDVTQTAEWEEAFNHCQTVFKCSVEVLVNNAGIGPNINHQLVLRINIEGVMNGSQAFLDRFGKTKVELYNLYCMCIYVSSSSRSRATEHK